MIHGGLRSGALPLLVLLSVALSSGVQGCSAGNRSSLDASSLATRSVEAARRGQRLALDERERWLLKQLFGASLDVERVTLVHGAIMSEGAPRTVENEIHLPKDKPVEDPTFRRSMKHVVLLAHEATHVWQFQTRGLVYAADALANQGHAYATTGDRSQAYRYALDETTSFAALNAEQQGRLVEDYVRLVLYGAPPRGLTNADVLGLETFRARVEAELKAHVNPAFVSLEGAVARAIMSGESPPPATAP
ncbi:MAG: hypothetical protein KA712_08400 [Myxococcales bacterium]|nr:hypothetical protein [Myxococcales bacterium]